MHPPHHTCRHKQQRMNRSLHCTTILWCTVSEDFTTDVRLSDVFLSESQATVCVFESFHWWLGILFWSVFLFSMTTYSERTEEWKLHFARKCCVRKDILSVGKWTKGSLLQKPTGCGTTTRKCCLLTDSLPCPRHASTSMEMTILFQFALGIMTSSWE